LKKKAKTMKFKGDGNISVDGGVNLYCENVGIMKDKLNGH
jgi:hypothetical protein